MLALALGFAFVNGFHDASNAIATVVSTRVLRARTAIAVATVMNLAGAAFALMIPRVVDTFGRDLVNGELLGPGAVGIALVCATGWNLLTWWLRTPSSSSHALVGALYGVALGWGGFSAIFAPGLLRVALAIAMMPLLGVVAGTLGLVLTLRLVRRQSPAILVPAFRNLQIASASFVAFTHGLADVQRTLGALALAAGGVRPGWGTAIAAALVISLGTAAGGWRLVETMGMRIVKLRPVDGFVAESVSAGLTALAAIAGLPASTTHAMASSIVGVGVTYRASAVSWGLTQRIVIVWLLTPIVPGVIACLIGALTAH